jgi:hypothetical protein
MDKALALAVPPPPKGVVGRDALGKLQEPPKEVFFRAAEFLDLDEVVATAQHATEADDQNIDQTMPQIFALPSGIRDRLQGFHQVRPLLGRHNSSSLTVESESVLPDLTEYGKPKSLS